MPVRSGVIPRPMKYIGSGFTTVQVATRPLSGNGAYFITAQPGVSATLALQFMLQDIEQYATFSALFDQYMIEEVQVCVIPRSNALAYNAATALNQVNPSLYIVIDRDDNATLTTANDAAQYDNMLQINAVTGANVKLRPSIATALWSSGVFTGYSIGGPKWIDIANTAVPHYGVKVVCQPLQASFTETISWDFTIRYRIAFRNVR